MPTDYSTACGAAPLSLIQMLAACMVVYGGHVRLNTIEISTGSCANLTSFWDCDNNGTDPERALVENLFALDACGRLALKTYKQ